MTSVEPPGQLVEDLIYEDRMHSLSSEPGEGKTNVALWVAGEVVKQGLPVLYLDAENGPALVAERLAGMGADPEAFDEGLHYFPAPEIGTDPDSLAALRATAEAVRPALAVFDSWPDFLALAGLDENSASEVTRWTLAVPQLLKDLGCAVLLLDHVTKSAEGRGRYARGSGAKLAKMDVAWSLAQTVPFDRERVGEISLTLRKDREAYLPVRQKFAVGGAGDGGGIVFRRVAGVIEETDEDGLTDRQRQAFDYLEARGEQGASWSELLAELGGSKGTLSNVLRELTRLNLLEKRHSRYHTCTPIEPENGVGKPDTEGSAGFNAGSIEPIEPGAPGRVQSGTPPLKGCTGEPGALNPSGRTVPEKVAGLLADPPAGVRLQVAEYRRQGSPRRLLNPLAAAVASELFGGPHRWREVLEAVEEHAGCDADCEEGP